MHKKSMQVDFPTKKLIDWGHKRGKAWKMSYLHIQYSVVILQPRIGCSQRRFTNLFVKWLNGIFSWHIHVKCPLFQLPLLVCITNLFSKVPSFECCCGHHFWNCFLSLWVKKFSHRRGTPRGMNKPKLIPYYEKCSVIPNWKLWD